MAKSFCRTYVLEHSANLGKLNCLQQTLSEYQKGAVAIANQQWKLFQTTGKFNKMAPIGPLDSPLSERYKQTIQYQVVGALESYVANCRRTFYRLTYKSTLTPECRKNLQRIFRTGAWVEETSEDLKLARCLLRRVFALHNKPDLSCCNMLLDAKECLSIEESTKGHFDYWVKLATIVPRKPIWVPLKTNTFFSSKKGRLCKALQVNRNWETRKLSFGFIKEFTQEEYTPETESIGLDLGLSNILTSNKGDLFGRSVFAYLKKFDGIISKLAADRQKQKLKVRCKRYDALVSRVRSYLKNELNRIVNRILELYKPAEIVVERLNFQNATLSKRLNRIIGKFGKGILTQKLSSIAEQFGINIVEVNPAYTSQECSSCHHVEKANRASRDAFKCCKCNFELHADVNAARNILSRRSIPELANVFISKVQVLQRLRRFYSPETSEREPCGCSPATVLMDPLPF